jgi:hypothetical protein
MRNFTRYAQSYKEHFRHTYCEGSTPISGTSVDSGVEDPDDYDHTVTWVTNGKNKMAQVIPNPMLLKPQNNVHEQKEMQYSGLNPNSMSQGYFLHNKYDGNVPCMI